MDISDSRKPFYLAGLALIATLATGARSPGPDFTQKGDLVRVPPAQRGTRVSTLPKCPTCLICTVSVHGTSKVDLNITWHNSYTLEVVELVDEHTATDVPVAEAASGDITDLDVAHTVDSTSGHSFELHVQTTEGDFMTSCGSQ